MKLRNVCLALAVAALTSGCSDVMDVPLMGNTRSEKEKDEVTEAQDKAEASHQVDPTAAIRVSPEDEHYIFELDEAVSREHVYYRNRYGIEIAGDLYVAKDAEDGVKYPALVVGPPFGGVKEQGPGVYANQLAKRGFIVLAFDPSYHGYSGGEPRYTGSTDFYAEDFSAGVDYLGTLENVDREKIGAIGICGSGGFALSAAAADARIKAIATSVMYDIAGFGNSATGDARQEMLSGLAKARWDEVDNGPTVNFSYPEEPVEEVPAELTGNNAEFFSFYGTKRGWHPNALGNVTATSDMSLMNFPSLAHLSEISPRPILFVAGENAHSLGFSETAYENASEPKELFVVPDAIHIDLYDDITKIPFDKLESFFKENLS